MLREHVDEYLLDECPNCGAPRKSDERECTFCGTSLVQTRVVRADVNSDHFPAVTEKNKKKALDNMDREPDLVCETAPKKAEIDAKLLGLTLAEIVSVVGAIAFLKVCIKGYDPGLTGFCALVCLILAGFLLKASINELGVLRAMDSGQVYTALILRVGRSMKVTDESGYYLELFVLADIEGTEKCIKLLAEDVPTWERNLVYPTGAEIAIKGYKRFFTVRDYMR